MWSIYSFFCQTAWHWGNIHWDSYKVRELILMVSSSTNVIAFLLLAQDWTTSFFHYPIASLIHKLKWFFLQSFCCFLWWTDDGCMYSVPLLIYEVWIAESVNSPMPTCILQYAALLSLFYSFHQFFRIQNVFVYSILLYSHLHWFTSFDNFLFIQWTFCDCQILHIYSVCCHSVILCSFNHASAHIH
jgi:hypothetical protein